MKWLLIIKIFSGLSGAQVDYDVIELSSWRSCGIVRNEVLESSPLEESLGIQKEAKCVGVPNNKLGEEDE